MKIIIDLSTFTRDDLRALLTLTPVQDALRDAITNAAIDDRLDELGDAILRVSRNLGKVPPGGKHDPAPDPTQLPTELQRLAEKIKEGYYATCNPHREFTNVGACRILTDLSSKWDDGEWQYIANFFGEDDPTEIQADLLYRRVLSSVHATKLIEVLFPQFKK